MKRIQCPYCGFMGHAVSSNDGRYWKYICERCRKIFVVDSKTEQVV